MRPLATSIITAAIFAVLASAAPAATTCLAPPGQGAIDQYCELVPAAGGDRPSAAAPRARDVLAPVTARALRRFGSDGRAVALLAQTSPAPAAAVLSRRRTRHVTRHVARHVTRPAQPHAVRVLAPVSTLAALRDDVFGGPPGSAWVPWAVLVLTLGGVAAWGFSRRRSPSS